MTTASVTGTGIISPLGNTVADFWAALCRGASGIRPITRFDTTDYAFKQGGEVQHFDATDPRLPPHTGLATRFMLAAADQALAALAATLRPHTALVLATNFGDADISFPLSRHPDSFSYLK